MLPDTNGRFHPTDCFVVLKEAKRLLRHSEIHSKSSRNDPEMLKWVMHFAVLCLTKQLQQHQICVTMQSEWGHAVRQLGHSLWLTVCRSIPGPTPSKKASAESCLHPGLLRNSLQAISLKTANCWHVDSTYRAIKTSTASHQLYLVKQRP